MLKLKIFKHSIIKNCFEIFNLKFRIYFVIGLIFLVIVYLWYILLIDPTDHSLNAVANVDHNIPAKILNLKTISLKAVSAVVYETHSRARIFNQNGDVPRSIASLTKLMTAITFLDTKPDWNKEIVVKQSDIEAGAKANFFVNDKLKIKDVFTIALMASDNSAINVLVRSTGISEQDFVVLMNNKAKELRLNSFQFSDPTGLDVNNRGTALGVAKLAEKALAHPEIAAALKIYNFSFNVSPQVVRHAVSTDQLIGRTLPQGARMLIGKTGHLNEAGYCFVGVFEFKGKKIITAILGAPIAENRFSETIKVLDWTLRGYLWDNNR